MKRTSRLRKNMTFGPLKSVESTLVRMSLSASRSEGFLTSSTSNSPSARSTRPASRRTSPATEVEFVTAPKMKSSSMTPSSYSMIA